MRRNCYPKHAVRTENFHVILDVIGFRKSQGDSHSDVSVNSIVAINIEFVSRTYIVS